jgi:hypothetical protein
MRALIGLSYSMNTLSMAENLSNVHPRTAA